MSRQVALTDHLQQYILANSVREPTVLAQLRAETAQLAQASMQIGAEQGQFMALLAKLIGARRCLEIGVFTGYSSLVVALALPNDGKIVACDVSEEWTAIARRYWTLAGVDHKIDLRLRRATRTLDELIERGESGSYDYAFIDADKTNYDAYYERVLTLLRPGGLVLLDNVLWSGRVADPAVTDADTVALRELNAKVHRDERVDVSLVGIGDGLLLARKR
ncbi:MAG TPA: class I SAM-dependent methyltransferase [Povalibacter sp.]|jgi:caffeoyl-CoA O-methyltransferase|nr:class I SAM-dependent methyltransferase [Povalibacter sp.]